MNHHDTGIEDLIQHQLIPRGVRDSRVLDAFRAVPREKFVPEDVRARAFDNSALDIGCGQTISQPLMIGLMLQVLDVQPDDMVLEIGAGSGYQAALLGKLGRSVVSIERIPELAERAQRTLEENGFENVRVIVADGSKGWPNEAPYDRIIAACAAPRVPEALVEQLADGGRLVAPVGSRLSQQLAVVDRVEGQTQTKCQDRCVFVPLIGEQGWPEEQ